MATPVDAPVDGARAAGAASARGVPVWLLDVDGVLNTSRPGWGAAPHAMTAYADGRSWRIRWEPALVSRLRSLHVSGTVEVRWCTSWCPHAHQLEAGMRLPELARTLAEDEVSPEVLDAAKLRVALRVLEVERRPLIWTDDEAIPVEGPDRDRLEGASSPALLIAPRPNRGLRPEHLEDVDRFLASLTDVADR